MGETLYICTDCEQPTNDTRSECCDGCDQTVCNACLPDHKRVHCADLDNYAECESCSKSFKNYAYDDATGAGDVEGVACPVCEVIFCGECTPAHMQSAEHLEGVKEAEEAKAAVEAQATLKRKRHASPTFQAKRAKLKVELQTAKAAYASIKAAAQFLRVARKRAKQRLARHDA